MQLFSVPKLTSNGKPYAVKLYESLVKERYIISNNLNTSYTDTANVTPLERRLLLDFIIDDLKKRKDMIEQSHTKQR